MREARFGVGTWVLLLTMFLATNLIAAEGPSMDAEAYKDRGFSYLSKGQYDEAIADFTKALEINQSDAEAISDYTKALEINPALADVYVNRGNDHGSKGENDQAIANHTKALEISPQFAWEDVHKAQELGIEIEAGFLKNLSEASGREK